MTFYCIGWSTLHILSDVLLIYLLLLVLGPSSLSILLAWVICLGHLLYGYTMVFRRDVVHSYVSWTMPHCVLTLKLIGETTLCVKDPFPIMKDYNEGVPAC